MRIFKYTKTNNYKLKDLNKFRGCLIGGAVGDALGSSVEFMFLPNIKRKYGQLGITRYDLNKGKALISDDTQMTLFTANGLLYGQTQNQMLGKNKEYEFYISLAYKDWYYTQYKNVPQEYNNITWIYNIAELHAQRAPGGTCIESLSKSTDEILQNINNPINNSKGCGGVMRVAPVGLYFNPQYKSKEDIYLLGAKISALTHGHPLSHISSYFMTAIINNIVYKNEKLINSIKSALSSVNKNMKKYSKDLKYFTKLINSAISLSKLDMADENAIDKLGEGWVAEETIAIAVYASLKYSDSFEKAIICAVNHSGDSDSTGALTGNIMGAYLGYDSIPTYYKENLELKETIFELATDLYNDCPVNQDELWISKYVHAIKNN